MVFEDLEGRKLARVMTREIYELTRMNVIVRDFGLCDQVQRAAVSTMSYLAEGFERHHVPEKLQFYNVAHASNGEVRSLTYVIEDNYPSLSVQAAELRKKSAQTGQLVGGLIRSTEALKSKLAKLLTSHFALLAVAYPLSALHALT